MVDPWVQNNPACPDSLKKVDDLDAMLITHGHFDHIGDAVEIAGAAKPEAVVGIFEKCNWLEKKKVEGCQAMNKGGTVEVAGIRVTMLHADHSCGIKDDDGSIIYGGEAVGYLMEMENGLRVYQAGDTAIFGDVALYGELFKPDVAVLPIGDLFTMDPRQAARAAQMLGVKQVIPSHHSTFPALTGTPAALREELEKLAYECEVIELKPGDSHEF
jgi:L-ascorbate metabolism protein UlaG (beta-lactamase superfamily)